MHRQQSLKLTKPSIIKLSGNNAKVGRTPRSAADPLAGLPLYPITSRILNPLQAIIFLALALTPAMSADFSGQRAFDFTKKAVSFGERPSGSEAIAKTQAFILSQLKKLKCQITEDAFIAETPAGKVPMRNIIATFPGPSGRMIVVSGHYDTKPMPGFTGANDGGSSTGFLLELAHALNHAPRKHSIVLVFFDGEEAVRDWSDTDSLYGSRHLAMKWEAGKTLHKINALINVDMIGDANLDLQRNPNGSQTLTRLIWEVAAEKGYQRSFQNDYLAIEDDHIPFYRRGVSAVDLIDFNYGPGNSHWHTVADSLDKLSYKSFQVIGDVVLGTIMRLEKQ